MSMRAHNYESYKVRAKWLGYTVIEQDGKIITKHKLNTLTKTFKNKREFIRWVIIQERYF